MKPFPCIMAALLLGALALPPPSPAQELGPDYTLANQLLQQQEYELAYERFLELHRRNPGRYLFLDRLTECLINLKRYGEALERTEKYLSGGENRVQAMIRLGEIHHIRGDSARADSVWNRIEENPDTGLNELLGLARTLRERRAFRRSVEVYRTAGERFNNSSLVASELANTHLMAGNYGEAAREYLELIEKDPTRLEEFQSILIRNNDDRLFDTAILELEEFLSGLRRDHPAYVRLHQLHVWLLMERELYRRALSTSVAFEERSSEVTYNLYSTGRRLASERQFELAEEAFRYYIDKNIPSVLQRSMHELAQVYMEWAEYLEDFNLAYAGRRDSLYRQAYGLLDRLRTAGRPYSNLEEVLVSQSELALDHLHRPQEARKYLERLESMDDSTLVSRTQYLRGRILLYEEEYRRARVALTSSNRRQRTGPLAEKARYYLALSDFYAGDFEFAGLQIQALESQNTSYFANDAVRLKVWIQEGLQADSTGGLLEHFAAADRHISQGADERALNLLADFIGKKGWNPLKDDALLRMAKLARLSNVTRIYPALRRYLEGEGRGSPLAERLMWERARMADQWVRSEARAASPGQEAGLPAGQDEVLSLYEEILLRFPDGFYTTFARNRIQEIKQTTET